MTRRKLLVEGWRFLPHSYAIVNQWQLLALARRSDLELRVRDLPLYGKSWKTSDQVLGAEPAAALRALAAPESGFVPDVTLRIAAPFDVKPVPAGRLAVYCTSEYHNYLPEAWVTAPSAVDWPNRRDLMLITPSRWSAEGLRHIGVPEAAIKIASHGVDSTVFAPDEAARRDMRQRLGIGAGVVFMSAGAMTPNKGIDLLLRSFAELCRRRADVYLLTKGADELYRSNARLGALLHELGADLAQQIGRRLIYGGTTLSSAQMANLYRAADVYVSPYRAEGFNLPVLEAMASGLPVICTGGGSTDDFVSRDGAWKIASRRAAVPMPQGPAGVQLLPDPEHLLALMAQAAADEQWRRYAGAANLQQAQLLSWDAAVERLLEILF